MRYINAFFGWMWRRKLFLTTIVASSMLFALWSFPFNDLSDAVTSAVSRFTGNQVYLQAQQLNIHLIPQPAVSADNLTVETTLPPVAATWAKITPGIFSIVFNLSSVIKAIRGDAEASRNLLSRIDLNVDAEGVWGGDVAIAKSSTRITLNVEEVNLKDLGEWAELPMSLQGRANFATDIRVSADLQPEGDYELKIAKFVMPAATVNVPMQGAVLPVSLPTLTLADVTLKGRMVDGKFFIEEGMFGKSQDPVYGRIKGQLDIRLMQQQGTLVPQFGEYSLSVDLTTSPEIQKDKTLALAFIPLENAKDATSGGGAKYLFKATGVLGGFPSITRTSTF